MKVVAFNGSARKNGNTSLLMETVFKELDAQGIETEKVDVGVKPVRGCIACMKCWDNKDGMPSCWTWTALGEPAGRVSLNARILWELIRDSRDQRLKISKYHVHLQE